MLLHSMRRAEAGRSPACVGLSRSTPPLDFREVRGGNSASAAAAAAPNPNPNGGAPRDFRYTCVGSSVYKVPARGTKRPDGMGPTPGDDDFPLCRGVEVLVERTRRDQGQTQQPPRKHDAIPQHVHGAPPIRPPSRSPNPGNGLDGVQTVPNVLAEYASRALGGSDFPQRFQRSASRIAGHCSRNASALAGALSESTAQAFRWRPWSPPKGREPPRAS